MRRRTLLGSAALCAFTLAGCHLILGLQGADDSNRGDGGVTDPVSATCRAYCREITTECTGDIRQYQNEQHCQVYCAQLEQRGGPAFSCRISTLEDTGADCAAVGPLGVGVTECEREPCDLYCDLMNTACRDTSLEEQGGPTGADRSDCLEICEQLPVSAFAVPVSSLLMGNDLNCRIQHINVALSFPAGTPSRDDHCLHAAGRPGRGGNQPCGPDVTGIDHAGH